MLFSIVSLGALKKVKTGLRRWFEFYRNVLEGMQSGLPPTVDQLLAYSEMFRHPKTYKDYVGYVKTGCEMVGAPLEVFAHPSLKRAVTAVAKRENIVPREPMFLRFDTVERLVTLAMQPSRDPRLGLIFLAGYACLLRVPSECLPAVAHRLDQRDCLQDPRRTPIVRVTDEKLEWYLPRRKNRLRPVTIIRKCWCRASPVTCPVHAVGAYVQRLGPGERLFNGLHRVRLHRSLLRVRVFASVRAL